MMKNGEWNSVALTPSDRHHNITRCSRARDIYGDARCTPNRIWSEHPVKCDSAAPLRRAKVRAGYRDRCTSNAGVWRKCIDLRTWRKRFRATSRIARKATETSSRASFLRCAFRVGVARVAGVAILGADGRAGGSHLLAPATP